LNTATRLYAEQLNNHALLCSRVKRFFSSQKLPNPLWALFTYVFNRYWGHSA